jgi:hypothetical protein
MTARLHKAEELKKGDVLALPFQKTATIVTDPTIGRTFVSFRTEYGPTRVERGSEHLVEE